MQQLTAEQVVKVSGNGSEIFNAECRWDIGMYAASSITLIGSAFLTGPAAIVAIPTSLYVWADSANDMLRSCTASASEQVERDQNGNLVRKSS
jgi:hypothetical protein